MEFDARDIKGLQPGMHLTTDAYPGLRLEVTKSTRTWIYRYKSPVDGLMKQIKVGEWPSISKHTAIAEWEKLRATRAGGRDPAAEKRAVRREAKAAAASERAAKGHGILTVRKVAEDYLVNYVERRRKPKGAKEVRRMFDTMLGEFASASALTLTRSQSFNLLEMHAHIPVQCAKLRAELGAAWAYALDAGRLPETTPNWWRQIMRGRLRSKGKKIEGQPIGATKRVLSEAELGELIRWLPNFSKTVADVLTLYLWTCTRGSEICSMNVSEISDGEDGLWWTIPREKTKNARRDNATDLRVPLVGRAAAVVRRRILVAKQGFIFPATGLAKGNAIEQKTVQTAVHYHQPYSKTNPDRERPRLTVTHWAPHDLRRSSRTLLASMGCLNEVAEAILGHMPPGVKGIYNRHTYDKERREWLTRLDARLEEISSGRKN